MKVINKFLQESKRYTIYQDLDGCLTDFKKAVEDLGAGSIEELESQGDHVFWSTIKKGGVKFWSEMPWMPDGKELWNYVKRYDAKILSAPAKSTESRVGKASWVRRNLGTKVELILSRARDKMKYADKNSILIDDREDNIKGWKDAGGIGILHTSAKNTILKLKKLGI